MSLAKRVVKRGTLAVGSSTLIATATVLVVCCLWLLSVNRGDEGGLALATVITGFIAAAFTVLPAAVMAAFMASKSIKYREPPYHYLPVRMRDPFRGVTAAAFPLSIVPCALGLSLPSEYATCSSNQTVWHLGFPCQLLKVAWGLCLVMMTLTLMVLLPLRSAVGASTILPLKTSIDAESTSSLEKPETLSYAYLSTERPPTREQQRWLQKRNSLSSQKAIYPYAFEPRRSASNFGAGGYHAFPRSTNTLRSYSFSESQPTLASTRAYSFSTVSRPTTSRSSTAGSRPMTAFSSSAGSVHSRRYRLDLSADCPSIPESPRQLSLSKTAAEDALADRPKTAASEVPAPPAPAWCPPLSHAPLSSDPAIRALTGSTSHVSLERQSRLQMLVGSPAMLSRQTTTRTSLLDSSRPSTAPSSASSSGSGSSASTSPTRTRTQAFASALGTGLPASPRPVVLHPVALPPPPKEDPPPLPPAIPRRATGHSLAAVSRPPSSGGSTIRHLRKPSPLRVRKQRGGQTTAATATAQRGEDQAQDRDQKKSQEEIAVAEELRRGAAQQGQGQAQGQAQAQVQAPRAQRGRGKAAAAAAVVVRQGVELGTRLGVAVAAASGGVGGSGLDGGGGGGVRNIHEERGRERIARGGWCMETQGGYGYGYGQVGG